MLLANEMGEAAVTASSGSEEAFWIQGKKPFEESLRVINVNNELPENEGEFAKLDALSSSTLLRR
jgi:hypothetical protein